MADMVKLGVVIFNNDFFSKDGLAALQWASVFLKESQRVHILIVNKVDEPNQSTENIGLEDKCNKDGLLAAVAKIGKEKSVTDERINTFDMYVNNFRTKDADFSYRTYTFGLNKNLQERLKGAIDKLKLNTLVLGMPAGGWSTTGPIDPLQLNSKCSVVLLKSAPPPPVDPKPVPNKTQDGSSSKETSRKKNQPVPSKTQDGSSSKETSRKNQPVPKKNRDGNSRRT